MSSLATCELSAGTKPSSLCCSCLLLRSGAAALIAAAVVILCASTAARYLWKAGDKNTSVNRGLFRRYCGNPLMPDICGEFSRAGGCFRSKMKLRKSKAFQTCWVVSFYQMLYASSRPLNYISNSMHNAHNICMNCFLLTSLCPTGFRRSAGVPLPPCKSISCCVLLDFQNVKPALLEMQHLE